MNPRITILLQKIDEIQQRTGQKSVIDADLMLDYLRVLYADVYEWRNNIAARDAIRAAIQEPSLDEWAAAMNDGAEPKTAEEIPVPTTASASAVEHNDDDAGVVARQDVAQEQALPSHQYQPLIPPRDFQKYLGINDRILLLNELFGGSQEKLSQAIAAINVSENLATAAAWLKEFARIEPDEDDLTKDLLFGLLHRFYSK